MNILVTIPTRENTEDVPPEYKKKHAYCWASVMARVGFQVESTPLNVFIS